MCFLGCKKCERLMIQELNALGRIFGIEEQRRSINQASKPDLMRYYEESKKTNEKISLLMEANRKKDPLYCGRSRLLYCGRSRL